MRSDAIHALEGLGQRVRALNDRSVQLVTLRDRLVAERDGARDEVEDLSKSIELLTKVSELFRVLMDILVVQQVHAVENVVTEGLQTIFHDQDLSFEADVGPKYNKVAVEFFIREGSKDNPLSHRGKPLEAFGGGPSSIASLALRILTVLRLKLWPLLVLDEALVAVSDDYIDQTGQFLQSLADKLGFDVMLVTHKPAFLDHADVAYRCSNVAKEDGTKKLVLEGVA